MELNKKTIIKRFKFVDNTKNNSKSISLGNIIIENFEPCLNNNKVKKSNNSNSTAIKKYKEQQLTDKNANKLSIIDYFDTLNPYSSLIKPNSTDTNLNNFIQANFSTPYHKLNIQNSSKLLELILPSERSIMIRLLVDRLDLNLRYSKSTPIYLNNSSSSDDDNNSGDDSSNTNDNYDLDFLKNFENLTINENLCELEFNDNLTPIEHHLIHLYFSYFDLVKGFVHKELFFIKLQTHWNTLNFQALLSIMLCSACQYLKAEPFPSSSQVNSIKLGEYYFKRSQILFNSLSNDKINYPVKIQILKLITYLNYNMVAENFTIMHRLIKELGWDKILDNSIDNIKLTKPCKIGDYLGLLEWEENMLILSCTFFNSSPIMLTGIYTIEGLDLYKPLSNIEPILEALFDSSTCSQWLNSRELKLNYLLYKSFPILESARLYNLTNSSSPRSDKYPSTNQLTIMYSIQYKLNTWKDTIVNYVSENNFKSKELALAAISFIYFNYGKLITIIPHLPKTLEEFELPFYFELFKEFLKCSNSLLMWMNCQGYWMIIFTSGVKNFVLSLAYTGLKLLQNYLNLTTMRRNSELEELVNIMRLNLLKTLTNSFRFSFNKKDLTWELASRRCIAYWEGIRIDPVLNCCIRPVKPPKLGNNTDLKILN